MAANTFFLSRAFLRSYGLVAAWSVFGAGILLITGRVSVVAMFTLLAGLAMATVAFRGKSLKEGDYLVIGSDSC